MLYSDSKFNIIIFLFIVHLLRFFINGTEWHPYIHNKNYPSMCYNRSDNNANSPKELKLEYQSEYWKKKILSSNTIEKYNLWPDIISKFDFMNGETMFGFEEALEIIYNHQHPVDCSQAKFLISGMYESGFGSELHVIGVGLATAMNLGRVYIMNPYRKMDSMNAWQVDIPFCKKQGDDKLNLDCYYEPWSNCTIKDALGSRSIMDLRDNNLHPDGYNREVYQDKFKDEKVIIVELGDYDWDLPKVLEPILHCSPVEPSKYRYWWRAMSVTYLMRLNHPTRQLIQHYRHNHRSLHFNKENEQCISVYARRGDKHLEMFILKNETVFFETAKELWKNLQPRLNINQEKPIMFVASEDAQVIESAISWGLRNNWKILYTDLFDRRKVLAGYNTSERDIWVKHNKVHYHHLEYFSMLLNIDSHLQCSAFICSMPSNFCRVIDELKATVAAKANTPLADFHDGTNIPCYTGDCITIGWR